MCSHEIVNLVIRDLRRFAPKGSEPNAGAVNYICQDKIKIFKQTCYHKHSVFSQCRNENEYFSRRGNCWPQSVGLLKYVAKLFEEF